MADTKRTPLNGTKTHPLSDHAKDVLRRLEGGPFPVQEMNAGVWNRFAREDLAEIVMLPSPYKVHKGGKIQFARITDAGRAAIAKATGAT